MKVDQKIEKNFIINHEGDVNAISTTVRTRLRRKDFLYETEGLNPKKDITKKELEE